MDTMDSRDARWTALTATVAGLEAKVASLERARRADKVRSVIGLVAGVVLSCVVALSVGAHAQTTPQTLVCKELKVVGDDGKTRVDLSNEDGGNCGYIETYNASGTRLTSIGSVSGSKNGFIGTFSGSSGKGLVQLSDVKHDRDDRYDGAFETFTADGKALVQITTDHKDNGSLEIDDKDGTTLKTLP